MAFSVTRNLIKQTDPLYGYCADVTSAGKDLYNAAMYLLRNNFTAAGKVKRGEVLTPNEREVRERVLNVTDRTVLTYTVLNKLLYAGPQYKALPAHMAQRTLKTAAEAFKGWLSALSGYKKDSSRFLGRPKMPGYLKGTRYTVTSSNQECYIKNGYLKLPKTKLCLRVPENGRLLNVRIKPYYDCFLILCCFESTAAEPLSAGGVLAIDLGIDNIAACISDEEAFLIKGGIIKSRNQWFNKELARLRGAGGNTDRLCRKRDCFMRDAMHKISRRIVDYCTGHDIGTLVIGYNKGWKQHSNIGRRNNQTFVQIPLGLLRFMLEYKAQAAGLNVIYQEESYTSKASAADSDPLPVYGEPAPAFSGRRISRGLYRTADGTIINADINGAANIMRKAGLGSPTVKSIPVKRIEAA